MTATDRRGAKRRAAPARPARPARGDAPALPDSVAWATDVALVLAIVIVGYFFHLPLAAYEHLTPDAAGYLDMGINLFSGRGAVTTYNLYQYWPGTQHPFPAYMQPGYPILAGLLYKLDGIRGVTSFNLLLNAVNGGLLYLLSRRALGRTTALLAALYVSFHPNLLYTAIHPWTEPLHTATLLAALMLFLNDRISRVWVGVLLGIGCLVRFAGVYNAAALFVAVAVLHGFRRRTFAECAGMAAGFLAVMVPYELFCLVRYGAIYPEYLAAAKRYTIAMNEGGAVYRDALPVLGVSGIPSPGLREMAGHFTNHVTALLRTMGPTAWLGGAAVAGTAWRRAGARDPFLVATTCVGVLSILAYAASLAWNRGIEQDRYSVLPIAMLVPAGFAVVRAALTRPAAGPELRFWLGTAAVAGFLFAMTFTSYARFRLKHGFQFPESLNEYRAERSEVVSWIKANAPKDAKVASEFLKDPFYFERPFVSLPSGKALAPEPFNRFLDVYRPEYLLFANPATARLISDRGGYRIALRTARLILLEREDVPAR